MGGYDNVGGAWETCTGAINFVCLISFLDFSVAMLSAKKCVTITNCLLFI